MARAKFKTPKENRVKKSLTPYVIVIGIILFVYAISLIVPLLWGLMTTFKTVHQSTLPGDILKFPDISWWQKLSSKPYHDTIFGNYVNFFMTAKVENTISYLYGWNLQQEKTILISQGFLNFVTNTFLYAGVSAFLTIMTPCIMGYLCAKFPNKFASFLYTFVIVVITLPIVGTGAATLTLMKRLSLHDTFWGLWIRECSFMNMYFLIFFAFFKGLPNTYSEAAEIDGAGYFRIMWTIYIPFAIKMITTAFLIQFVAKYNTYDINLVNLPSRITLAYAAYIYMHKGGNQRPIEYAACYTLCLPMFIFFVAFKNKLMGNMTVGGLKG